MCGRNFDNQSIKFSEDFSVNMSDVEHLIKQHSLYVTKLVFIDCPCTDVIKTIKITQF